MRHFVRVVPPSDGSGVKWFTPINPHGVCYAPATVMPEHAALGVHDPEPNQILHAEVDAVVGGANTYRLTLSVTRVGEVPRQAHLILRYGPLEGVQWVWRR